MQHDAEPQKSQDGQLVVNMMWNHRDAPSQWCDRGAFYPVLGGGGITRKLEVHDRQATPMGAAAGAPLCPAPPRQLCERWQRGGAGHSRAASRGCDACPNVSHSAYAPRGQWRLSGLPGKLWGGMSGLYHRQGLWRWLYRWQPDVSGSTRVCV